MPCLLLGGGLALALWSIGPCWFVIRMDAYVAAATISEKASFPNGETFFCAQLIGAGD